MTQYDEPPPGYPSSDEDWENRTAWNGSTSHLREWHAERLSDLAANPPQPMTFLLRRMWPADAYGVAAAESKAGKTWLMLDVGVSVALGVPALDGIEVDRPGPVLVFLGEGGRRNALRRLRAVCAAKGYEPADVEDLHLCYRSPDLGDAVAAAAITAMVAAIEPVLIIIDPLYLSAAGAKGSSLYDMAEVLRRIQDVAELHRSALIVAHHWNQSGKGSGFGRMSGAGPEEWGRVLWTIEVAERGVSSWPDGSLVRLTVRFRGGEIPDGGFTLTREVWTDDPDDLNSVMHYGLQRGPIIAGDTSGSRLTARDRVVAMLTEGAWMDPHAVQDLDAEWSKTQLGLFPLKLDTVKKALRDLHTDGVLERRDLGQTFEYALSNPDEVG